MVPGIWEARDCCQILYHAINIALDWEGGGLGGWWLRRSSEIPHMLHATLLRVLLHFHSCVTLRCCAFSCASRHTSSYVALVLLLHAYVCYATVRSLALPHIRHATLLYVLFAFPHVRHATLLYVLLHFHTYVMLRCCTFSLHFHTYVMLRCCTFSLHFHTYVMLRRCTFSLHFHIYVMLRCCTFSLHFHTYVMLRCCTFSLHFHTYVMLGCCTFSLHFHTYVMLRCCTFSLHFHTYVMLRCCTFSLRFHTYVMPRTAVRSLCTSTHTSCYTAARSLLHCAAVNSRALPHIHHDDGDDDDEDDDEDDGDNDDDDHDDDDDGDVLILWYFDMFWYVLMCFDVLKCFDGGDDGMLKFMFVLMFMTMLVRKLKVSVLALSNFPCETFESWQQSPASQMPGAKKKCNRYFQMVCQKLWQNSVSGWGSLEDSNLYFVFWQVLISFPDILLTFGGCCCFWNCCFCFCFL